MKNKIYHTVGTVLKIEEKNGKNGESIDILTFINDRLLSWLHIGTSIKSFIFLSFVVFYWNIPIMTIRLLQINVRENRRGNPEWAIKKHWQHWIYQTQDEDTHKKRRKRKEKTKRKRKNNIHTTQKTKNDQRGLVIHVVIRTGGNQWHARKISRSLLTRKISRSLLTRKM